jgi:hypothetical protein
MTFMGSTNDQREMAPKATLMRHSNDHFPPCVILPSYFEGVRTLSSFSILQHLSYWIPHWCWYIAFHGVRQTKGLLWWNYLGA